MIYAMIAFVVWATLWRQSQLDGLPDVGEPFDVAAYRQISKPADDRNAFVPYRRAGERFREMSHAEGVSFSNANLSWSRGDATIRGWVADQAEAIAFLRSGSERSEAHLETTKGLTGSLVAAERFELIRRLSWIGDAALFEADRLRTQGDMVGAWKLFNAVTRTSRHMIRVGGTVPARTTATILVQFASAPVAEWASDPAVTVPLLRQALADLAAAEAMTPPISLVYKDEYLNAEQSLTNKALPEFSSVEAFLHREPERSRRVLRLLIANDLAWIDRPATERPAFGVPRLKIYDSDSTTPPAARALPPDALSKWVDSSLIAPTLIWRLDDLEKWDRNDRWSINRLKEAVAVPLFTRDVGRPPDLPRRGHSPLSAPAERLSPTR